MFRYYLLFFLFGCQPPPGDAAPTVLTTLSPLAVVAEPPEAEPGETVRFTAYFVDPTTKGPVRARVSRCPRGEHSGSYASPCSRDVNARQCA